MKRKEEKGKGEKKKRNGKKIRVENRRENED